MFAYQSPILNGLVVSGWGRDRSYRGEGAWHEGMDFRAPVGTPVYAAAGGKVVTSRNALPNSAGEYIAILHGDGTLTRYMHLSQRLVAVGSTVRQGQLIAYSGATGIQQSEAHLHFDLRGTPAAVAQYRARYGTPAPHGFGKDIGGYIAIPAEPFMPVTLSERTLADAKRNNLAIYTGGGTAVIFVALGLAAGYYIMLRDKRAA